MPALEGPDRGKAEPQVGLVLERVEHVVAHALQVRGAGNHGIRLGPQQPVVQLLQHGVTHTTRRERRRFLSGYLPRLDP